MCVYIYEIYMRVVSLTATAVEHLVTGETMQMSSSAEQRSSMDYYLQRTYYKTASLISNSCKTIALLTGQTAEVAMLAYKYGKNLVCKNQQYEGDILLI
ncbi:putative all-trans-nonaprenyl-diphosphate synthase (geranyl-diphosphate specific) [Helianthus debilis subsp. tardiflorus]